MPTHRWVKPFLELLRQGMSPEKIALTISLGLVLGIIPVLGSTTILCTLAALALRLNLPAINLVNGLVYPLQLILLIPFYRLGAWMFQVDATAISLAGVVALMRAGVWHAITTLWMITMHALVAWLALGAVICVIFYVVLVPLVRQVSKRARKRSTALAVG